MGLAADAPVRLELVEDDIGGDDDEGSGDAAE